MAFPKQREVEEILVEELRKAGGEARPRDLYVKIAARFPVLTPQELRQKMRDGRKNKWQNLVQWARQNLVTRGVIDQSVWGVWKLTEPTPAQSFPEQTAPQENLASSVGSDQVTKALLGTLRALPPNGFQSLVTGKLLPSLGMTDIKVRAFSKDGGIDGEGMLEVVEEHSVAGIKETTTVRQRCAVQVKRWSTSISRPDVQTFRGAITGQFDRGFYITTSEFTKDAADEARRAGAPPITIIDGATLAALLLDKGLGIKEVTVRIPDPEFFKTFMG